MVPPCLQVNVVSITTSVYSGQATFVVLPGELGELGILPGHAPLMAWLRAGWMRLQFSQGEEEKQVYVSGGMVEVQPYRVTVLLDFVIEERITAELGLKDVKLETESLLKARVTAFEYAKMEAELYKALNDLQGTQKLRLRKPNSWALGDL